MTVTAGPAFVDPGRARAPLAALAPGSRARWRALDAHRVGVSAGEGETPEVVYRLHSHGIPLEVRTLAWGDPCGTGLCEHLDVTVVVVPHGQDPDPEREPTSRAPLVVGDDGSASCAPAVRFAVDRARDRRAPLIVVRIGDVRVTFDDPPEQAADAGVAVRVVVADDRSDRVLLARSWWGRRSDPG